MPILDGRGNPVTTIYTTSGKKLLELSDKEFMFDRVSLRKADLTGKRILDFGVIDVDFNSADFSYSIIKDMDVAGQKNKFTRVKLHNTQIINLLGNGFLVWHSPSISNSVLDNFAPWAVTISKGNIHKTTIKNIHRFGIFRNCFITNTKFMDTKDLHFFLDDKYSKRYFKNVLFKGIDTELMTFSSVGFDNVIFQNVKLERLVFSDKCNLLKTKWMNVNVDELVIKEHCIFDSNNLPVHKELTEK